MSSGERDVLGRLDALGLAWYVTGSWALAAYAEPRMTSDIDVVVDVCRRLERPRLDAIMTRLADEFAAGTWSGFERPRP